jgi:hypothetical protein
VTDGCGAGQAFELASLELGLATFKFARAARDGDRSASLEHRDHRGRRSDHRDQGL